MSNTPFVPDNKPGVAISDLHFPVVGLGASAGGIEALRDFFSHTSSNPMMAFVVIVHLSPDHESVLDRILQAATGMPVVQVTHPQRIQCNHVYVIPPASVLAMNDGYLSVKPTQPSQGSRVAIDEFFRTLADVHTTRAE